MKKLKRNGQKEVFDGLFNDLKIYIIFAEKTMAKKRIRIRHGFEGEKLISIPVSVLTKTIQNTPFCPVYITHIGYYPNARYHYRDRRNGCDDNILFYCLRGKGYYMLGGVKYEIHANQFVIIPATTKPLSYWANQNDPWTIYWVHFTGGGLPALNLLLRIGMDNSPVYIPYNKEGVKIWNKMYDSLSQGYSIENMANANFCLYHFIATFIYSQKHHIREEDDYIEKDLVGKAIDFMKQNLDKKLSVKEIAEYNHLSESHFSKRFHMSTGMSPIDYFIHLRMQQACHLLHTTDLRIKQIAGMLGYEDPYYFSRIFKKSMNTSPEDYRISIKKIF